MLAVTPVAAADSGQDGDAAFERLRQFLGSIQDLRADFRQEIVGPDQELVEQAAGTVVLSKPGRFRWDYREPYERVIVADGERVWLYEADLEQVTVRRLAAGLGDTPAALLTGNEEALARFDFVGVREQGGIEWLDLAARSVEADFSTVALGFSGDELQRIEFVDRLGQRTRVFLSAIDRAPQLTDADFSFEIPDGVDVIDEDDL